MKAYLQLASFMNPAISKTYLFHSVLIAVFIIVIAGCALSPEKNAGYVTVITTMPFADSSDILRAEMSGRDYEITNVDTAFIRENITFYIVPILKSAECVAGIKDMSNNDSSILVVAIKADHNPVVARYHIDSLLKAERENIPDNLNDPNVIQGRPEEW